MKIIATASLSITSNLSSRVTYKVGFSPSESVPSESSTIDNIALDQKLTESFYCGIYGILRVHSWWCFYKFLSTLPNDDGPTISNIIALNYKKRLPKFT